MPEGTPDEESLYLIVYPKSSHNTDIITFMIINMIIIPAAVSLSTEQGSIRHNIEVILKKTNFQFTIVTNDHLTKTDLHKVANGANAIRGNLRPGRNLPT